MKINELNTKDGGRENPCALISRYLLHEEDGGTLTTFLQTFEFDSRHEIEVAIRMFFRTVYGDPYMNKKHLEEYNPLAAAVVRRVQRIFEDQSRFDKYPIVTSGEIWHGGFSRQRLNERTAALFDVVPDAKAFAKACERLRAVYNLTADDIAKLHFFVEQVKAGDRFPNSLRRMLYIWGNEKKTGKTTSATMIVSILNGDTDEANIGRYSTTLSNEMQIKNFAVPKISECNVCLMDECFYADMGKTYSDFKRFMTSSNGRARLPFGQEFEWVGQPNYVSTSNDPLKKFIKDWNDRRYLSIHFAAKPAVKMSFDEIKKLWGAFILNSEQPKPFEEWALEIDPISEEQGERDIIANEFETELRKSNMTKRIMDLPTPVNKSGADNKITAKTFTDWFAESIGSVEAHKRKGEIEAAVIKVYGERYSTTNYWRLTDLQEIARNLHDDALRPEPAATVEDDDDENDLPF